MKRNILNLTQHPASPEQIAAGVIDLEGADKERLTDLLTFELVNGQPPSWAYVLETAGEIARLAKQRSLMAQDCLIESAMIGGAPYLMGPLARSLAYVGMSTVFSFSVRKTSEQVQPDGSIRKTSVFRHAGFVRQVTV